jgi:hypothetical protein
MRSREFQTPLPHDFEASVPVFVGGTEGTDFAGGTKKLEASSKAREYLKRTLHRFYGWMLRNPEMSADAMQELELALVEHGYPEDADGIRRAQNALKRGLYRLHVSRGIMLHPVTCKLEQRYRQITNPHRFTGAV